VVLEVVTYGQAAVMTQGTNIHSINPAALQNGQEQTYKHYSTQTCRCGHFMSILINVKKRIIKLKSMNLSCSINLKDTAQKKS
jgi:hypothetical protein